MNHEKSISAQGYYSEKQATQRFTKPKKTIHSKYSSRNRNRSDSEFSSVNENNFTSQANELKKRTSVDVQNKLANKTINHDMTTFSSKKLVPKVSLLRKLPRESQERLNSSKCNNIRSNRIGSRKESEGLTKSNKRFQRNRSPPNLFVSISRESYQDYGSGTGILQTSEYEDPQIFTQQ
jgi:hypothetical protein